MSTFALARQIEAAGYFFAKCPDELWRCYDSATFELVPEVEHKEKGKVVRLVAEKLGESLNEEQTHE